MGIISLIKETEEACHWFFEWKIHFNLMPKVSGLSQYNIACSFHGHLNKILYKLSKCFPLPKSHHFHLLLIEFQMVHTKLSQTLGKLNNSAIWTRQKSDRKRWYAAIQTRTSCLLGLPTWTFLLQNIFQSSFFFNLKYTLKYSITKKKNLYFMMTRKK